ncbi:hypothetical protein [Pseudonocardia sp. D17]|jgi:hypothetical protein|uniref:hypothetical protein n=1 Tax=Pseudonocardia sp. D17 TaxID=882661 RepID=UPI002B3885B5|nr:hypothetical protein PSD17_00530 [Pseudonocardia sp. D17]
MHAQQMTVDERSLGAFPFAAPTADMLMEAVAHAAHGSAQATGPTPWYIDAVPDGVAMRMIVRRWTEASSPDAVLARIAAGTALRAARLAVVGFGRRPVTAHGPEPGVVAVLRAGGRREPCPEETAMLDGQRRSGVPRRPDPVVPEVGLLPWLRRAAEREGAWARSTGPMPHVDVGPAWPDGRAVPEHPSGLLLGTDGLALHADVRLGQAIEAVRLTAAALGWWTRIAAAPADRDRLREALRGSARAVLGAHRRGATMAVLQLSPALAFVAA